MELHQIRYFLSVCETLNFTRAANACNVSQPALSRAIMQLEAELGGRLFHRERSVTRITELGNAVLPVLRQSYDGMLAARAVAKSRLSERHEQLNLGLSRSLQIARLSPLLGEIAQNFPCIQMRIWRGPPSEMVAWLKDGRVEMVLSDTLGEGGKRLKATPLYEERFGLALHRQHQLASKSLIKLSDLVNTRFLCLSECGLSALLAEKIEGIGASSVRGHEVPLIDDLTSLVRGNFGIGILPVNDPLPNDICIRDIDGLDLRRWMNVYTVAGRQHSQAVSTLKRLLCANDWSTVVLARPYREERRERPSYLRRPAGRLHQTVSTRLD